VRARLPQGPRPAGRAPSLFTATPTSSHPFPGAKHNGHAPRGPWAGDAAGMQVAGRSGRAGLAARCSRGTGAPRDVPMRAAGPWRARAPTAADQQRSRPRHAGPWGSASALTGEGELQGWFSSGLEASGPAPRARAPPHGGRRRRRCRRRRRGHRRRRPAAEPLRPAAGGRRCGCAPRSGRAGSKPACEPAAPLRRRHLST
jgi:hypothetical protein